MPRVSKKRPEEDRLERVRVGTPVEVSRTRAMRLDLYRNASGEHVLFVLICEPADDGMEARHWVPRRNTKGLKVAPEAVATILAELAKSAEGWGDDPSASPPTTREPDGR